MHLRKPFILVLAAVPLFAQHGFTPADIQSGERLYISNCSVCHGAEGNMVPGTDLGHGNFRRANTDAGLAQIIRSGIPGTAMPPHNLMEFDALTIVAFLRSLASESHSTVVPGNAANGQAIFEGKGNCRNCHRVAGAGSRVGPDLSDIGLNRRAASLERSLVQPDAEILPQNRYIRAVPKEGAPITGRLLNQDAFTVQLMDQKERLLSLNRTDLKEYTFLDKSPMPSYQGRLTSAEIADLVSYLVSLKGIR